MLNRELGTPPNFRPWLALIGGLLIGAAIGYFVFFGLPSTTDEAEPQPPAPQPQIALAGLETGSPAPGFELRASDGSTVGLQDHEGDVVLLNFSIQEAEFRSYSKCVATPQRSY